MRVILIKGSKKGDLAVTIDLDMILLNGRRKNMRKLLDLVAGNDEAVGWVKCEIGELEKSIDALEVMKKRLGSTRENKKTTPELIEITKARLQKASPHKRITQSDIAADLDVTRETVSRIVKNNKELK